MEHDDPPEPTAGPPLKFVDAIQLLAALVTIQTFDTFIAAMAAGALIAPVLLRVMRRLGRERVGMALLAALLFAVELPSPRALEDHGSATTTEGSHARRIKEVPPIRLKRMRITTRRRG